ncbi:hypothetical protein BBP00_00004912 [Phytophthora kernoviae]|uniref:Hsp70-Hsp90 organising protein n=1 Tax=Phytophthora kernoviae TaxID=325452 RepID=A0A3F2RQF6_9STRA|nr:hypothetical protein BBP00_00004912 [Phytophthora kernoviae]
MDMRSLIHQGSSPRSDAPASASFPTGVSSALPAPSFPQMRPQPTIFQRSAPSSVAPPTLAPLRFIIPSSRPNTGFPHSNSVLPSSAAPSSSSHQQQQPMYPMTSEPEREPQPQHSMLYPQDRYTIKTEPQSDMDLSSNDLQEKPKKHTPKRSRTPKLSNRSTKSKARPGLRKGKWTDEESRYATQLTNYFKEGLLPLERGTMLRLYLSQKLNCEPMRITKKFTGGECIGKQVFRPCSPTPESRIRLMQAQLELVSLEAAFLKRLKENREEAPVPTDEFDARPSSSGHRSRPVPLKPRVYRDDDDQTGGSSPSDDVDDASAVGLLLDFFYKANRNEKGEGKSSPAGKNQVKEEPTETSEPSSPTETINSENDTSVNSPTKRMRALSVSGYVDAADAKRSRVAKDRGNRAFSAGRYADAVSSFSEALAIAPDAANAHVFYSNRSAAQLKLGKAAEALQDAEQCVTRKPDWPKGYSRKGSALYALGQYPDAYRAYTDGLKREASNAGLLEGLRLVEGKLLNQRGSSPSTTSSAPVASLRNFLLGDKRSIFQLFQFVLRSLLLLCFLSFWIPVFLPSYFAFANFFKIAVLNHASYLFFTHGVPKWQASYAQRLLLDPAAQAFFFCLVFWVSEPHGMALMPVFLLEMVHFFSYLTSLLQVLGLAESPLVTLVANKALVPLTARIISDPSWPALATKAKWAKLYTRMPQVAANIEVVIGVALILELLTPSRNFLLLMLYWQVLRVRYMISPQLQEAFRILHMTILTVVNHPRCPAVLASVYGKIHTFAAKMADPQQQQQAAGGGLASRCNVM